MVASEHPEEREHGQGCKDELNSRFSFIELIRLFSVFRGYRPERHMEIGKNTSTSSVEARRVPTRFLDYVAGGSHETHEKICVIWVICG